MSAPDAGGPAADVSSMCSGWGFESVLWRLCFIKTSACPCLPVWVGACLCPGKVVPFSLSDKSSPALAHDTHIILNLEHIGGMLDMYLNVPWPSLKRGGEEVGGEGSGCVAFPMALSFASKLEHSVPTTLQV